MKKKYYAYIVILSIFCITGKMVHFDPMLYIHPPSVLAQIIYDQQCPSGTSPVSALQFRTQQDHIVQQGCVDLNGSLMIAGGSVVYLSRGGGSSIINRANSASIFFPLIGNGPVGKIAFPPGSYNIGSDTLVCANGISYDMTNVELDYTTTTLTAIKCQNVQFSGIIGVPYFNNLGGTTGTSIGLLFGIGSGGNGLVTTNNTLSGIFVGWNKACVFDGSASNNGTYNNNFPYLYCSNSNKGFFAVPTVPNFVNANWIGQLVTKGNISDGVTIDGSNGWVIGLLDTELNGGFGQNFPSTQTTSFMAENLWDETNTSGGVNCGNRNFQQNTIIGHIASTPARSGNCTGVGNLWRTNAVFDFYGLPLTSYITPETHGNFQGAVSNTETPPSGVLNVLGCLSSNTNIGNCFIGSPELPTIDRTGPAGLSTSRIKTNQGTTETSGQYTLSAGWGTTASVSAPVGFDPDSSFTVTSSGTGQAANPTITFTFKDGTWTTIPGCFAAQIGGTGTISDLTTTTESATAPIFTWNGTPVATSTYRITIKCGGR